MWTPRDLDQTQSNSPAIAPQPTSGPMSNPDFLAQYQQILAPYQAKAQQIYGGDPVFGNSSFAQNHPTASHIMSNLLLAASKSQPGATVGDSIRIAANMALAPRQAQQQQQMKLAEAPGKLMSPELQLLQHLSQINYQNSEIQRNKAYEDYLSGARTDQVEAAANAKNNPLPKTHFGPVEQDPTNPNQMLQPEYDSATGQFIRSVPIAGTRPPSAGAANADSTLPGIVHALSNTAPGTPEHQKALDAANTYSTIQSGNVNNNEIARRNAKNAVPDVQEQTNALIAQTHADLIKDLPPMQNRQSYGDQYVKDGRPWEQQEANYQKEVVDKRTQEVYNRQTQFNAWRQSDALKGIPFDSKKDYTKKAQSSPSDSTGTNPFRQPKQ